MPLSDRWRFPAALLDTTVDQLRTLLAVHEAGTALGAARLLGREQSSVQKQIDTLNRNFGTLCGEPLVLKRGRSQNVLFTATGESLVELARGTLEDWRREVREARRRLGSHLVVGSTRYTLGFLLNAVKSVTGDFDRRGVELKVEHVRTRDLLERVDSKELDLVCGSVLTRAGHDGRLDGFEVMEWRRSGLALVTNLGPQELPGPSVRARRLPELPLAVSADGLIPGFLRGWFGGRYRQELHIAAEIDTVQYGLDLLASGVLRGCVLVTQGIGDAVADGRLQTGAGLRTLELEDDIGPELEVLVGVFVRAGERAAQDDTHPLNVLWGALAGENARWRRVMRPDAPERPVP
ncbi:LysR family transcriptional regulator [Streptomyces sp. NEAU-Y11]|uniref:LysR family transcriptional regulator n=1 Tax=Streptomyces cucumeris TaxID=2962890 RepID=UPI0020C92807|nr:LysR family transcriptional regulator [Streptomyces sp. NEAU-Y11]MCP9208872.1 LysR family transcriptional regulator [Streptomyces sp. NEAU-Y11]